jgi:hypothetical protein
MAHKNSPNKFLNRLIDTDLSGYFRDIKDLPKPTNYEFIKAYIRGRRTDIGQIEAISEQLPSRKRSLLIKQLIMKLM